MAKYQSFKEFEEWRERQPAPSPAEVAARAEYDRQAEDDYYDTHRRYG